MKLTSSNFSTAMGLNPYKTRQKLWGEMTGRIEPEDLSDNPDIMRGVENEFRAVAAVEAITGLLFDVTGDNQTHIETPCSMYGTTPDGIVSHRAIGLEVKCPRYLSDTVPPHYLPQVQGQCWIANFSTVYFGQWTPEESRVWVVNRSDEYIEQMRELLQDFIECLETDTKPKRRKKPVMPELTTERI